jgi:hypothetical protein
MEKILFWPAQRSPLEGNRSDRNSGDHFACHSRTADAALLSVRGADFLRYESGSFDGKQVAFDAEAADLEVDI